MGKNLNASDTLKTTKIVCAKQRATRTSRTESAETCTPLYFLIIPRCRTTYIVKLKIPGRNENLDSKSRYLWEEEPSQQPITRRVALASARNIV